MNLHLKLNIAVLFFNDNCQQFTTAINTNHTVNILYVDYNAFPMYTIQPKH